jgi:acetylornithine deacetylase
MSHTAPSDPLSHDAVTRLLQDLVSIPSVNPTLAPEEGVGEAAIAAFCRDWL